MDIKNIGIGYPDKIGNEYTFAGVLRKFFSYSEEGESISEPWNSEENTIKPYIRDYEKRILPAIDSKMKMSEFNEDAFVEVIKRIRRSNPDYSDERIDHMIRLVWRCYKVGVDNGLYEDQLGWEGHLGRNIIINNGGETGEERTFRLVKNKKSLLLAEEKRLLDWALKLDPYKANGKEIGLLVMLLCGLRDNEACGITFGALRRITELDFPCLYIYQTTEVKRNTLKAGGKTKNAPRIIPIFEWLYSFIQKRRDYVQSVKGFGVDIEQYPLVCKDHDIKSHCRSDDLSRFAKSFFERKKIGIHAQDSLKQDLFYKKLDNEDIGEKNPTAYLLRRNYATHMYALGLDAGQIQYMIGHDIENEEEYRYFYNNEDTLKSIYELLKMHPFSKYLDNCDEWNMTVDSIDAEDKYSNACITIPKETAESEWRITINQNEVGDDILVKSDDLDNCRISCRANKNNTFKKEVNIRRIVNETF